MKKLSSIIFPVAVVTVLVLTFSACSKEKFHINGAISNANEKTLYFENMSLDGPVIVDSVKLNEEGAFSFAEERPGAPEFYRLRIENQIINLSVDSTETITVKGAYPTMAVQYTVEGSENCNKIKELALKQIALQQQVIAIQQNTSLGYEATGDSINRVVERYKEDIKRNYIFKEPMKASSYFALFQALGNQLIFNPRANKDDIKVFAAVATSWDTYYPEAVRGENLHNIALEGMKNQRIIDYRNNMQIDASKVNVTNILDIVLPDNKGVTRKLTDLAGKVVLLDFHIFATKDSPARIMKLREVYNKYHAQGLEIYQVSLDPDEHFWKQQTAALPWVSVREDKGASSSTLAVYQVQTVPEYFLIDRDNNIVGRSQTIQDLEQSIRSLIGK